MPDPNGRVLRFRPRPPAEPRRRDDAADLAELRASAAAKPAPKSETAAMTGDLARQRPPPPRDAPKGRDRTKPKGRNR